MAIVQFEPDHKKLMARFKQKPDKDTAKTFVKIDEIAKKLADKTLKPDDRSAMVNKLKDQVKKLITKIAADIKNREKELREATQKPPEGFNPFVAKGTFNNIKRELLNLQRKAQTFANNGGQPPPPPKLPELHFGADYKKVIVENDGTLAPSVVMALDKLDENANAQKVAELVKAAREAVEKQLAALAAERSKLREPKPLLAITKFMTKLTKFSRALEDFEMRVFLIHRLAR
ncbi:MAG TPA: hypothetical protein VK961_02680 [Chthoniobacter sp.]|nr:hypothetical protein [Chthoniobacter sp.]